MAPRGGPAQVSEQSLQPREVFANVVDMHNQTTTRTTVTRAGTRDTAFRICRGQNHHDHGYLATCDQCGASVLQWVDDNERTKKISDTGPGSDFCFHPAHECRADEIEAHTTATANTIRKGATIEVVKGRKIPHGTTGVVFWVATEPDAYGVYKIGFTTDTGDKHFANIENVALKAAR